MNSSPNIPFPISAGTWGVTPGVGPVAAIIRRATHSPVGHAVMYIGDGQVIEATWPKVRAANAPTTNVIWATGQPLTAAQRVQVVVRAHALLGDPYDIWVYPWLLLAMLQASITKDVEPLFTSDKWRDCSGLIEDCDSFAGAPMFLDPISNFVTPAMLYSFGAEKGWFAEKAWFGP